MSKASRKQVVKLNIGNNASTVWQQLRINTIGAVIHYTVQCLWHGILAFYRQLTLNS